MTPLRQRMTEDMQLRNLGSETQRAYLTLHHRPGAILSNQPCQPEPGGDPRIPALPDRPAPALAGIRELFRFRGQVPL